MYYFIKRHDFLLLKFTGVFLNNALVVNVFLDIHVFIIKTKVLLSREQVTVADLANLFRPFGFITPEDF